MRQLDVFTHTVSLATLGNITTCNLGYANVIPMPPTIKNAVVCQPVGLTSLLPIQNPLNLLSSKAIVSEETGGANPVIMGFVDQSSFKHQLLPGETVLYGGGSAGSNTTNIKLDTTGNITISSNAMQAQVVVSAAGTITLKTATKAYDLDLIIANINAIVSDLNLIKTVLSTPGNFVSAAPGSPVTGTATLPVSYPLTSTPL